MTGSSRNASRGRYPTGQAWPKVRVIIEAYGSAIAAIAVLFSLSNVPNERLVDFETYYARQPTVAALLMIYLVSATIGAGILAYACLTWARTNDYADRPWLRRGLRLYGIAALAAFLTFLEKILAVGANWFAVHTFDTLNEAVPLVVSFPGMLAAVGAVVLPIWGPRWPLLRNGLQRWQAFRTLRPMHQALRHVDPDVVFVARGRRFDPYHRVRRQLIELSDWRWTLTNLFDPAVAERARRLGEQASLADAELRAIIEAALLKVALADFLAGRRGGSEHLAANTDEDAHDDMDLTSELARWRTIARAFMSSPIVVATTTQFDANHGGEEPAVQASPDTSRL